MNRKIVYIVLAALAVLLLMILLWWWFLQRESSSVQTTGTFGSAQTASTTNQAGGSVQGNVANALPGQETSTAGTQTNIQLGAIGGGASGPPSPGAPVSIVPAQGQVGVPGVIWLSGTPGSVGGGRTSGPGTVFNPTPINQIAGSNPSGSPSGSINISIGSNGQQVSGAGGLGLAGAAAIAAAAGALSCGAAQALEAAGIATGIGGAGGAVGAGAALSAASSVLGGPSVSVIDIGTHSQLKLGFTSLIGLSTSQLGLQTARGTINEFWSCIARTIAKVALNQITNSVVNWINSGFNGSPAFVQNPTQFFQQTADVAAGSFIQSSALSFLCSPFQLQIKIAIAQSYAQRNANACTLTQVTSNINNFMNGLFSNSGGWPAFVSFTTMPTNNPYGAFLYASVGLNTATMNAVGQKQQELLQGGGFLSFQQKQNCTTTQTPPPSSPNKSVQEISTVGGTDYRVCDLVTTTPGHVIADALGATQNSVFTELDVAKSFDEIISALITQLITRVLQNGLSNVSGAGGYASTFYTSDQSQAQSQSSGLLMQMQSDTALAQQYASIQQGSISDIENSQNQLNSLYNCWSSVSASSTSAGSAASNASQASSTIASLNTSIAGYNNRITLANNAIVLLQNFESQALSAGSTSDINSITTSYNSAKSSGQIPTQTDVTNATQNRTTLQSQLSALNSQTTASLTQCNASH